MKDSWAIEEILVGFLVLITTVMTWYPFKFFNAQTGIGIMFFYGIVVSALVLLIVGVFMLVSAFSYDSLSLAKNVNVGTSALVVFAAVVLLFFQMVGMGQYWLHVLFGIGLLSYAVGRVFFGALTAQTYFGLRVFNSAIGVSIGVLSTIVILFPRVLVSSASGVNVYYPYGYFTNVAFVLIGIDCLVSASLSMLFNRQKRRLGQRRAGAKVKKVNHHKL